MDASSTHRRSGWVALLCTMTARMLLGVLASLLLWSVAPIAAGWHPTVVMTGSMLPRLVPGDVVFSRPVAPDAITLGQVLLYDDPDRAHHLRMHRYVRPAAGGDLITRGDANPADDSTPVARSAVHGVASLRVPFVARPVLWAQSGDVPALAITALALIGLVVVARWFRAAPADEDTPRAGGGPGGPGEPAAAAAAPEPADATPGVPRRELVSAGRVLRVATAIGAFVVAGVLFAVSAGAVVPFGRTTTTPTETFQAARYNSCANAVVGAGARFSWPLGETGGSTANDVSGNALSGTYAGGVTYGTPGPCLFDRSTGVTLNGTSGVVSTAATATNIPALSFQIWFRTASARGGTLMSITATTGFVFTTDTTSMAMAMTTSGAITLGVTASGTRTVTTGGGWADNRWHLAVGSVGASGMSLSVDAQTPVTSPAATTTTAVTGTPRVGYGNASDLGTGSNDYFTGSLAYATLYKTALTSAQVADQYLAATAS